MWSMGVIAYVLLSGVMPFRGSEAEMMAAIKDCRFSMDSPAWKNVSDNGRDFVLKLMTADFEQRMSAETALQHPWIVEREGMEETAPAVSEDVVNSLKQFSRASSFRKVCFSMMAYNMSREERMQVRKAFEAMDTEKNGRISMQELKQVLGENVADSELQTMMSSLDFNHDDKFSYTDFLAAMMTSRIAQNEMHVRSAFNRLDKDGSGFITLANLREVLGTSHNGEEVESLLKEADLSGDGQISYEEFMLYIQGDGVSENHQEAIIRVIDAEKQSPSTSKPAEAAAPGAPAPAAAPAAAPATAAQTDTAAPKGPEVVQPAAGADAAKGTEAKSSCCTVM